MLSQAILKEYIPRKPDATENKKKEVLIKAERLYNIGDKVSKAFEDGIFSFKDKFQKKSQMCSINSYQIG